MHRSTGSAATGPALRRGRRDPPPTRPQYRERSDRLAPERSDGAAPPRRCAPGRDGRCAPGTVVRWRRTPSAVTRVRPHRCAPGRDGRCAPGTVARTIVAWPDLDDRHTTMQVAAWDPIASTIGSSLAPSP